MPVLSGGCYTVQTCGNTIDTQIMAFQGTNTTGPFSYNDDNGPICGGTQASINFVPTFTNFTRVDVRQFNCRPGGTSSITVRIRQNNNLTITSSAAAMCAGETRSLTATPSRTTATPLNGSGNRGTFSGTGVSGTTFTAPTPGGASQTYTITYTFGFCTRTQSITVFNNPSVANAGTNQVINTPNATLAGNTPTIGSGTWTVVNGTGTFSNATDPTATVTGLSPGTNTFRWTIANGPCTASSSDVTIVYDNAAPSLTCPGTQTASFSAGCQYTIPDLTTLANVSDAIDPNPQLFQNPPAGTTINGTGGNVNQTITIVALDEAGNGSNCTFTLAISDNTPPTVSCPGTQTVNADTNCMAMVPDFTALAAPSDNCSGAASISLVQNPAAGSMISTSTTITLTATDQAGNAGNCTFPLNIVDAIAPSAVCQDVTVQLDAGGNATVSGADINQASSDNCTSLSNLALVSSPSNFDCNDVGTTTAVLSVADQAGNTDSCTASITIEDNITPNAVCQSSQTIFLDANGNATLTGSIVDAGSSDNCSIVSRTVSDTIFDCNDLGSNSVTLTVTDASGNISTCNAPVTVADSLAPTIINCPTDTTVSVIPSNCSALVFWTAPTGADNCNLTSLTPNTTSGSTFPVGTTTVTYTALDQSSNSTTCSFNVTVVDDELPDLNCPTNMVVSADTGQCSAVATWAPVNPTDNCGMDTVFSTRSSGDTFSIGTTQVFYVATDVNFNSDTCMFTVEVTDDEDPVISCPANIIVTGDSGQCGGNVTWPPVSATDNCGLDTVIGNVVNGSFLPVGTTTGVYVASDDAGNVDTCTFTIDVVDAEPPQVFCPNVPAVSNDSGLCGAVVTWNPLTAIDNCNIDTLINTAAPGDTFPVGTTQVFYFAIDESNNLDTCTFDVVVTDAEAPSITCPTNVVLTADSSTCTAVAAWPTPQTTDNCGIDTVISTVQLGTPLPVGQTMVSLLAADFSSNADTCTFMVTVDAAPLVNAPLQASYSCNTGVSCNGATDGAITAQATGGCAPYSYLWSTNDSTAGISSLGAGSYTVTITDGNGSVLVDSFTVTEPAPVQTSIAADSLICIGDSSSIIDLSVTGGADCSGYLYNWSTSDTTEDLFGVGSGTYSVTVTDANGCTAVDSITVTSVPSPVVDLGLDTTVCAGTGVQLDAGGGFASYAWSTGDTTQTTSVVNPGTYTVTVTNAIGCPGSDDVIVTNFPVNNAIISPNSNLFVCQSDSLELTASSSFSNYSWSTGSTAQSILVAAPGGQVTIEATDGNGCSVGDTVFVDFKNIPNPNPVIVPGPVVNLCPGTSATLDAGAFASYDWSDGSTTQNITVSNGGSFAVTVTNADGCVGESAPVTVNNVPNPTPAITQSGSQLTATGGPFATYQWLLNGNQISGATQDTYTATTTGTYSVTVTDSNGCKGTSTTLVVTVGAEAAANSLLGIDLYPNPTNGIVHVRTLTPINWNVDIRVTDMYGKVVKAFQYGSIQNKVELDLMDVANGMYLMNIRDEKGRTNTIRFVIE